MMPRTVREVTCGRGMTRALAITAAVLVTGPALSGEGDGRPETERVYYDAPDEDGTLAGGVVNLVRPQNGGGAGTADAQSLIKSAGASIDIVRSFDGLDRRTAGHEGVMVFPPDTIVAASRQKVLEASNVGLRLSNVRGRRAKIKSWNQVLGGS